MKFALKDTDCDHTVKYLVLKSCLFLFVGQLPRTVGWSEPSAGRVISPWEIWFQDLGEWGSRKEPSILEVYTKVFVRLFQ